MVETISPMQLMVDELADKVYARLQERVSTQNTQKPLPAQYQVFQQDNRLLYFLAFLIAAIVILGIILYFLERRDRR